MTGIRPILKGAELILGCAIGLLAILPVSRSYSQTGVPQREIQRDTQTLEAVQRASEDARVLRESEDLPISFSDVLSRPDDLALNFGFARQQMREGDLKGSAATLERILLIDPEQQAVRLLYAIVLVRLDSFPDAERELRELAAQSLPTDIRSEVERYLAQVTRRQQSTRLSGTLSMGGEYNSNPTSVTINRLTRVSEAHTRTGGPQRDVAKLAIAGLQLRHDLGYQDGHELFANSTIYVKSHSDPQARTQDVRAYNFDFGATWRMPDLADISPSLTFARADLARDRYLEAPGIKLLAERKLTPNFDVFTHAWLQRENVQAQTDNPSFHERSGRYVQYLGGMNYALSATHRLTLTYFNDYKELARNYNSYRSNGGAIAHNWLLGQGQFLITSLGGSLDEYRENDPFISEMRRRDWSFRFKSTYGLPFATMADLFDTTLPAHLADVVFTSTVELAKTGSTLENYNTRNAKVQFLFNKRVEF